MATAKARDVDAYIAGANPDARPHLEAIRKIITSTVPGVEESISYGVPFYKFHGQLAGFAVYKNHVSFGVSAGVLQPRERDALEEKGYKTGVRTVQIRFDQKVPTATIRQVLKGQARINRARAR